MASGGGVGPRRGRYGLRARRVPPAGAGVGGAARCRFGRIQMVGARLRVRRFALFSWSNRVNSCAESPPLPQMQSCTDSRAKVAEIDVNLEPAITETGPSRDQPAEDHPSLAPANDGFWEQFLTEQPGSNAHQEVQSERRDGDSKDYQTRTGDQENLWWGKKNVEQMTEKLGHLTSAEKT